MITTQIGLYDEQHQYLRCPRFRGHFLSPGVRTKIYESGKKTRLRNNRRCISLTWLQPFAIHVLQGIKPTWKIVNKMKRYFGSFHSFCLAIFWNWVWIHLLLFFIPHQHLLLVMYFGVSQHTKENFRIRNVPQDWHCLLWLRLHGNLLCGCDQLHRRNCPRPSSAEDRRHFCRWTS